MILGVCVDRVGEETVLNHSERAISNGGKGAESLTAPDPRDLNSRAEATAAAASASADIVDREARFPTEAFRSARTQRLLGIMVPTDLGGEGASVSDVVDVCYVLGRACASTAMIFAMHQIMVAILVRHARNSLWHNRFLRRLAKE